jgi:far upstream element-binding protein
MCSKKKRKIFKMIIVLASWLTSFTSYVFNKPLDQPPDCIDRRVSISGPPEEVRSARSMIQSLVDDALASQANRRGGDYGSSRATVTIHIPSNKVGVVIGRGGETIRDLQDRSGARINVTPDNAANPQSTDRPVTLIGDDAAVQRAKALIDEIIKGGEPNLDRVRSL